jgi:hypothetical protein
MAPYAGQGEADSQESSSIDIRLQKMRLSVPIDVQEQFLLLAWLIRFQVIFA